MNTTELNKLPDFEDLDLLVQQISELSLEYSLLDIEIKAREAEIVEKFTTDPKYFLNGKPISMVQLKSTVAYSGIEGELLKKRVELAETLSRLEGSKMMFQLERAKIEVWRTRSANERSAIS